MTADAITPRSIARNVITVLCERGQLRSRALPGCAALPRTCWQPHHLQVFRLYSQSHVPRGAKAQLADELGISPFDLARQFRVAQGILLEVYYVVGVLSPPRALGSPRATHHCLNVYDGVSEPKRLDRDGGVYWTQAPPGGRLSTTQHSLLRAAGTTLTAEDIGSINETASRDLSTSVEVHELEVAEAFRNLTGRAQPHAVLSVLRDLPATWRQAELDYRRLTRDGHRSAATAPAGLSQAGRA